MGAPAFPLRAHTMMNVPPARWIILLLLLGLTFERGGATGDLGLIHGRRMSQSLRPISRMVLRGTWKETSRQLTLLLHYVVENFLKECDLWLLHSPGDSLGAPLAVSLQQLGRPLRVVGPRVSEKGLELPAAAPDRGPACSAYIIVGSSAELLRSLVESPGFKSQLHNLGRFIFVTGQAAGAARLILDNPVMAWRPHALVIKECKGVNGVSYEVWSHEVFREDVPERVHLVERWRRGAARRGAQLFPDKLKDFHGNELRALTFHYPPSIVKLRSEDKKHRFDGVEIRLITTLAEALNFRLRLSIPSDGRMWYGIFDDLQRHLAHLGAANFFVTTSALQVVDMTVQHDEEPGCFITPLPAPLPRLVALVYPFAVEVWVVTVASLVVGTLLLYGLSLVTHRLLPPTRPPLTYAAAFLDGVRGFLGFGITEVPRSDVTRSYFIMWLWYGLLLTAVYRSSLTAFLTIPLSQAPIDTLHQLEASDIPEVGSVGTNLLAQLEASSDPVVRRLSNRYRAVATPEEGLTLTASRKYALMENRQFLEHVIAANFTNSLGEETLHVMRECFLAYRIALVMPKKSPYKPNFDAVVVRVVEAGLVEYWKEDMLRRSRRMGMAEPRNVGDERQFTVSDLEGAWFILGLGAMTASVALLVELATRHLDIPTLVS